MYEDFPARGRPRLSCREHHWIAPMRLTAAQPGPWLQPATLPAFSEQQQKHPGRATVQPPIQTNQRKPRDEAQTNFRGHPPPDRGRRYQERIQETLEAPYPQASVTIIVKLLSLAWVSISANALVTPYSTHNESWAPDFNRLSEGGRDCTGGRSIQRRADTKQRNQRRRERREGRPGQEKRMSHTQEE